MLRHLPFESFSLCVVGLLFYSANLVANQNDRATGIVSPLTAFVTQLSHGPIKDQPFATPGLSLKCFAHKSNDSYIGVKQEQVIAAPLVAVSAILDDFAGYTNWIDGVIASKGQDLGSGNWLVTTEQEIPIPFVSNIHTKMLYFTAKEARRTVYRYQLHESDSMIAYDGLIVLTKIDDRTTSFTEYDFFDAAWGMAKALGWRAIWKDSLRAIFQSDIALKTKAEHPQTAWKTILDDSNSMAKEQDFTKCIGNRSPIEEYMAN